MTTTYLLTPEAKNTRLSRWKAMGGCGLSMFADAEVHRHFFSLGVRPKDADPTLGEIACASVLAEREIARFGKDHLNLPGWAVPQVWR